MLLLDLFGSRNDAGCILREKRRKRSLRELYAS